MSIEENSDSVTVKLIVDGLEVGREIKRLFKLYPSNAHILADYFSDSTINFAYQLDKDKKQNIIYKLNVQKLPGKVDPKKIKIRVKFNLNLKDI